jgi:hypothetical protein
MSDLSNDTKKHTTESHETIPLMSLFWIINVEHNTVNTSSFIVQLVKLFCKISFQLEFTTVILKSFVRQYPVFSYSPFHSIFLEYLLLV